MGGENPKLGGVLERMLEGVGVYALDARVCYLNPAAERIFGKPAAEMLGRRLWDLCPEAAGSPFHQAFERVAAGGPPEVFDYFYPPFDRWFANRIERVGDRVHVISRDVTDDVRRRRRLEALARISEVLTADHRALEVALQTIATILTDVLDADCTLALLSPDRVWLDIMARVTRDPGALAAGGAVRRWPAGIGHPGEALRTRGAVLAEPAAVGREVDRAQDLALRDAAERYRVAWLIAAPLLVDDEAIGVLVAVRPAGERPLTADDRTLVAEIAASVGLYVAHARRRSEAARGTRRLESLLALTGRLARAASADEIARAVVDEGVAALDADLGALWLLSPDGRELLLQRERGFLPSHVAAFARMSVKDRATATCIETGRPVWIESRADYAARFPEMEASYRPIPAPPIAFGILPLLVEGRPVGCVNFTFHDERRLASDDRTYLEVLCSHAGEALHRARLYAELRDVSQTREAMIQASPAAIMLLDGDGVVEAWNPAAERIFGWSAADVLGKALPAVRPERQAELMTGLAHVLAGNVINGVTTRLSCRTGELDVEIYAAPVRLSDGRTCCLSMVVDVSQRVRNERGRHLVAEASAILTRSLDREQVLAQVVRLPLGDFSDGCAIELCREGGGPQRLVAGVDPQAAGARRTVTVPLAVGDRVLGSLAIATLTRELDEVDRAIVVELATHVAAAVDNARLYEEARQARREAEEASRAKDEFLAMLGHELRNPLAPIVTALHLQRMNSGDAGARERAVIERHVSHLVRLVDDLLDVSRITRGKIELKKQRVELADVVAGAIEMASPLVELRGQALTVSVPPRGLAVEGDPDRLAQVISNLLTNAVKYTEPGGQIAISGAREGADVVLSVRDSGVGIAPELLPQVFDLFVQGRQPADRSLGGLGLGLAIVRSLVRAHGGDVTARSEGVGRGTEMIIRLPASDGTSWAAAVPPEPASARAAAGGEPRRLLVVDDNVDAAVLLGDLLRAHGHLVEVVHDGPAALRVVERFAPHLALLDIGLPAMDGYELAQRLRERPGLGGVRLIALTGYGQHADRERASHTGFDAHVVKPVAPDRIVALVEELTAAAE